MIFPACYFLRDISCMIFHVSQMCQRLNNLISTLVSLWTFLSGKIPVTVYSLTSLCACVCACVRACVCACVRACVRACVCVHVCLFGYELVVLCMIALPCTLSVIRAALEFNQCMAFLTWAVVFKFLNTENSILQTAAVSLC